MKKTIVWVIVLIIIVALIAVFSGKNKGSEETGPIKIGFSAPLTGEVASLGENARAAVEIAVEEINSEGGINGRPLEVIYVDDGCDGKMAVNAAQKLLNVDKVQAAIFGLCSSTVLPTAPLFEEAQIIQISYSATSPLISDAGDYVFRNIPSDNFQGKKVAEYVYNILGKEKVAIIYMNSDWGVGISTAFEKALTELGGSAVIKETFDPAATDLRSQFTKVKNSDAQAIYFDAFPDATTVGIKQIKDLGIDLPIVGADSWDTPKLWQDLNGQGDGILFFAGKTNSTDEFKTKMREKTGTNEISYPSNYAYDAMKYLAQAMREVGTDSSKIKDYLYKTTFNGEVSQPVLKFDKNGDPSDAVYALKKVVGTEIVEVGQN